MPPGGPKLKSSHPRRTSAAHGLPSAARGASQIWSNSQESDHQATCDRLSSPPDTPHDRRSREDRPSGAASTAKTTRRTRRAPSGQPPSRSIISGLNNQRRAGDLIVTMLRCDSPRATHFSLPRRPTSRPSRHQNDPDPEAPYAPKPCSSLEIDGRPMDRAPWPRGRSKAAGAPGGPSRRTRPSKSGAAHRLSFLVHWEPTTALRQCRVAALWGSSSW